METMQAIKVMAKAANLPITHIGIAMGKRANYISVNLNKGRTPSAAIVARMASVCGYGLYLMPLDKAPKDAIQITADND